MKNKKLCDWNKTDIKENKTLLFTLIKTPNQYCKKCARTACDENYLCKAEKITQQI
ncbi:MAG: hypothetical protein PF445_08285 [Melioribacteraceae bacterium]|jgi:hypothetical protein|nr:hypothetical protein [Melioribacteraceae bacterium]